MTEKKGTFIETNKNLIVLTGLMLLVLAVYWQTVGFEFINFDDNIYVYQNPFVYNGLTRDNIYWAFTAFHSANWHPLTWLSHQFDATLFGLNAGSHHATNVLLHLINTLLAFTVFRQLTGGFWKSATVAALFAVHPVHVESVAWIAERKDVLSTLFWLLTMLAYLRFVGAKEKNGEDSKIQNPKSKIYYLSIVGLFALGLMAKPMLVTLPFVLLLLDIWPLERLKDRRDLVPLLIEKIPLFVLSVASAVITVIAQKTWGAVQTLEMLPFGTRFFNAVVAYVKYIIILFYPVDLAVWYPYNKNLPVWQVAGSAVVLLLISGLCWRFGRERKYLLTGWLWFLGTLVPVIGLVQVGVQSLADRYTYIPYFGLFIIAVWGAADLFEKFKFNKTAALALPVVIILILSALGFRQVSYWRDDETLYRHSIAVTTGNYLLMQNYCHALILEDRLDEAERQCRDSISANPEYAEAYNSLGIIQIKRQQLTEAAESFRTAIANDPAFAMYKVNLATALSQLGQPEEAEKNLQEAAAVASYKQNTRYWIDAIKNLALAYAQKNNYEKAEENFIRLLVIAPDNAEIRTNFALTLYAQKKYDEARQQIEAAISQNPELAESYNIYGKILTEQKKPEDAVRQFEKALQLKPDLAEAGESLKKLKEEENKK